MKKYALALDLIDDAELIAEYENYHKKSWPEVTDSIISSGILKMEIFRISNRLFMLMETTEDFSFSRKQEMDQLNEKVQEWENLMWKFQQPLPFAKQGEKWILMDRIFELDSVKKKDKVSE
ncbi:L-rhamnose mutarotase [Pedobacter rhizosphaerae]|uniref:L-rhamnose mutarotase n=1 Tax=Pedobacter rhizosphaerae TaxID=390241 RepID=A0A1H9R287_9SPHI|nr:L-rhamnose mutarotase [Pedobacter rhizosphaerae]SER66635.1 L-rhamnose mutarotase [Pedobacter rhizosphaerae]